MFDLAPRDLAHVDRGNHPIDVAGLAIDNLYPVGGGVHQFLRRRPQFVPHVLTGQPDGIALDISDAAANRPEVRWRFVGIGGDHLGHPLVGNANRVRRHLRQGRG